MTPYWNVCLWGVGDGLKCHSIAASIFRHDGSNRYICSHFHSRILRPAQMWMGCECWMPASVSVQGLICANLPRRNDVSQREGDLIRLHQHAEDLDLCLIYGISWELWHWKIAACGREMDFIILKVSVVVFLSLSSVVFIHFGSVLIISLSSCAQSVVPYKDKTRNCSGQNACQQAVMST